MSTTSNQQYQAAETVLLFNHGTRVHDEQVARVR